MSATYRSSPTKYNRNKRRRSKAAIEQIKAEMLAVVEADRPVSVRQVFYRLVSKGVIGKTEAEYKQTVCRLLGDMRRAGEIPFDWIADSTRWMRKPRTFGSLESMLSITTRAYRRALWDNQGAYVEIWLEKEALAGVLVEITDKWDAPLMVTRGYPSLSFLWTAAEQISYADRPTYLYYFGDLDPSGLDICRWVREQLRDFAPRAQICFERVAVTREQVKDYGLQTRPTKKSDSRSKGFRGESVEVDALAPTDLRALCEDCITRHVDNNALQQMLAVESAERDTLQTILNTLHSGEAAE